MINLKKVLFFLSSLFLGIDGVFAGSISDLFSNLGSGFNSIYNNANATYFFLVVGLFWALFILMWTGLKKVKHLDGRPAKVIAGMVTFMGVTLLVYGKSAEEVILLFKGSVGFFFSVVFGGIIIASGVWWAKSFEKKSYKVTIISWAVYAGTAFMIPVFNSFFNLVSNNLVSGADSVFASILVGINGGALLVGVFSLLSLHIGWLNSAFSHSKTSSNQAKIKTTLKEIEKEFARFNDGFKRRNQLISKLSGGNSKVERSREAPSATGGNTSDRIIPALEGNGFGRNT